MDDPRIELENLKQGSGQYDECDCGECEECGERRKRWVLQRDVEAEIAAAERLGALCGFIDNLELDRLGAANRERRAYELVKKAEGHLARCVEHWNRAQVELFACGPKN